MKVDISSLEEEIIKRLIPLDPDKIILFGSYAYGHPNDESDIDLFLLKNLKKNEIRDYALHAKKLLRDLIFSKKIGFDIFADSEERVGYRINAIGDQFYSEIIEQGKILYEK